MKKFETFRSGLGGVLYGIVWTISFFTILYSTNLSKHSYDGTQTLFLFIKMFLISAVVGFVISFLICLVFDACKKDDNEQTKDEKAMTNEEKIVESLREIRFHLRAVSTISYLFAGLVIGAGITKIFIL